MPSHSFRVLIVDDEQVIADSLAMIVSHSGHQALAVYSGLEAIEVAKEFNPQVLISDVLMPGIDGLELVGHFAKNYQDCRVLLMSGHADGTRVAQAYMSQGSLVVRFLPKPVAPKTILASIDQCRNGH